MGSLNILNGISVQSVDNMVVSERQGDNVASIICQEIDVDVVGEVVVNVVVEVVVNVVVVEVVVNVVVNLVSKVVGGVEMFQGVCST